MRLDIHSAAALGYDELRERLESLDVFAVLLDEKFKIVFKNRKNNLSTFGMKRGMSFKHFVSEADFSVISQMKPSEIFHTEVRRDDFRSSAEVICCEHGRIVLLDLHYAGLRTVLDDLYGRLSGYDISLYEPDALDASAHLRSRGPAEFMLKVLESHENAHDLPFFNFAAVLRSIVSETEHLSDDLRSRIELSLDIDEIISEGSERDFALIVAYISAFCIDSGEDGKVSLEVIDMEEDAMLRISAMTDFSAYELANLMSYKSKKDVFADINKSGFWFYIIRLIAECNLWDFSIEQGIDGFIVFTLRLPTVKSDEEYLLRDISPEYLSEIISLVFKI